MFIIQSRCNVHKYSLFSPGVMLYNVHKCSLFSPGEMLCNVHKCSLFSPGVMLSKNANNKILLSVKKIAGE